MIPQPTVYVGSPESPDDYDVFETEGITVYIRKGTQTKNGKLTVTLIKMLWMESLTVEGMEY